MRIDLHDDRDRSLPVRIGHAIVRRYIGRVPGPMLVLSYRPQLLAPSLGKYMFRGVSGRGPWSKGHAELFAALVSRLNACRF